MKADKEKYYLPVHAIDDIYAIIEKDNNSDEYRVKTWNKRWRDLDTTIAYYEKIVECLKQFKK
jgi:hypothetical protein